MANVSPLLSPDYWKDFTPNKKDIDFISTYLFDREVPLTEKELVPVLVTERLRVEREAFLKEKQGGCKVFQPKESYKVGEELVFPALGWEKGKITDIRVGINPSLGDFSVIDVAMESGKKSFAIGLKEHALNQPVGDDLDDSLMNLDEVLQENGTDLEQKLNQSLGADDDLAKIAGRWFPRALLMDVNAGHLNLAEAVLEEASGKPLSATALIEQVDMPAGDNLKLAEFSLNYAMQEDGRFDEVGPTGEVLWCLKRLEPMDVQQVPAVLRTTQIDHDAALLSADMMKLVEEIDDELTNFIFPLESAEATISLTYPHWRAGTLPVSRRVHGMFPTAYESERIHFSLVDEKTDQEMPVWLVRKHRYVAGLSGYYKKHELFPGSLIDIKKGKKPGQAIIAPRTRRPTRDWVRTVLVGSDGGIVFAMLKQNLSAQYNERMVVAVPDVTGVDEACAKVAKERIPFEQLISTTMREMIKLNVQAHVHAQELYSALNIVHRCPPEPMLAFLVGNSAYRHVGDMYFRMAEMETGNE